MQRTEFEVRAGDDRRLMVTALGPDDGDAVFLMHGTPGVRDVFASHAEDAAKRGVRHLIYSRPGYEKSDRMPNRLVADCASDVAAIADRLEVDRFSVIGESGGGPHALAVAALLPERVLAAATIAGGAPLQRDGDGRVELNEEALGEGNISEYRALFEGEAPLREFLEAEIRGLKEVKDKRDLLKALEQHELCPADFAILETAFGDSVLANWQRVGALGEIWGWFDDDHAHFADWGIDLARIEVPVTIWQGDKDRIVPLEEGERLAAHIPTADLRVCPGDGHLSLMRHYPAAIENLLACGA
jgi:pimeloyl-ACP methyl ester carboxylesterase